MRVFVPGGTGFLGAAVKKQLTSRGHDVVVGGRSELADVLMDVGRLRDNQWAGLLQLTAPDIILNLAGAGLSGYPVDPGVLSAVNSRWPAVLVEHARHQGGPPIVHVASSTEFLTDGNGQYESTYSASKAEGSKLVHQLHEEAPSKAAVVYVHNVYGPMQPPARFVKWVITQAQAKSELHLHYPGRIRDFIFIEDAARGLCESVETLHTSHGKEVGTGVGTSLHEVATTIFSLLNVDAHRITTNNTDEPDPFATTVANPNNLLSSSYVTLMDGLGETIETLKERES